MAHRASLSTSRASLDASFADASIGSIAAPSEAGSESFSEASGSMLGPNKNAVAYLVYHNRGDPRVAGYKQPTTRDIPQVKLPRVEAVDALEVDPYLSELKTFERHASPAADLSPAPPPLDSVPAVFFNADFHLDNPRVFDAVVGEDSSVLQEKLSWYVDVVEAHLEKEIAAASSQFFSATASFHSIEGQAAGLSRQIAAFKSVVGGIQSGVVAHFEETARLQTKLRDLDALLAALSQLSEFTMAVDSLASQDPAVILDRAAAARKIATQGIDLRRVTVTHQYFDKLSAAEGQARRDAALHLVNAFLADIRADTSHAVDIDSAYTLAERAGVTQQALNDYAHVVDLEVRALVRKQLPGATDDESQGLARSLHTLSAEDAEKMCRRLFTSLSTTFEKLQKQPVPLSTIQSAVKGADSRLARVLRVRKDPATILSVTQFERFFVDVSQFCDKCESITKTRPVELSEFLVAQTKLYIHTLHSSSDEKLAAAMDADDWRAAEILPQIQAAVDTISSAGSMDPSQWDLVSPDTKPTGTLRMLVDGQPYIASKSTQTLVGAIVKYLQLICVLPAVHVSDTAAALLELLRLFNHKAHHLILGFGAKATAGLKHISVKNLMLTSESLRLIYNLMGSLKRCTERHIPNSNTVVLDSFDSVQQNYFDHRSEIESKLVKLMSDKVSAYARQIASTDWSLRQPEANRYIQGLMNDTTKVARVAQEMLPQPLAQAIVAAIFSAYKPALLEAYGEVNVRNADEKENVLRDLRFFKAKEIALNGQSRSGDVIYESVKMFVGPDIPDREPDLATEPRPAISARASPRASIESGLTVDARQAFATAVAQGNAQAGIVDSALSSAKNSVTNGKSTSETLTAQSATAADDPRSVSNSGPASSESNGSGLATANGEIQKLQDIEPQQLAESEARKPLEKAEDAATKQSEEGNAEAKHQDGQSVKKQDEIKNQAEDDGAKQQVTDLGAMEQAEETEAKLKAEAKAKQQAEDAEARRHAEAEEAETQAVAEAKKQAEEAEGRRQAEQAEAKRQAEAKEAKAKKLADEAEAKKQAEQAEAKKQAVEAEAKKQAEEAEAKKQAEEAEAKKQAEEAEAKKKQAEEAEAKKKQAEEAEAKKQAEEAEAKKKQAEEAEAKKKQAEEAEAKKQAEEAEAKANAEAEAKKLADEAEARKQAEEAEAKKKQAEEAEAKKQAEEAEAKKKQAEEAEARKQAEEAEAKKQAEEAEAKANAEAEAKKLADEAEARKQAEEAEAKKKQAEEAEIKKQTEIDQQVEAKNEVAKTETARANGGDHLPVAQKDGTEAVHHPGQSEGNETEAENSGRGVTESEQDNNETSTMAGDDGTTNSPAADENSHSPAEPAADVSKEASTTEKKPASSANKNKRKKNNKKKKHK